MAIAAVNMPKKAYQGSGPEAAPKKVSGEPKTETASSQAVPEELHTGGRFEIEEPAGAQVADLVEAKEEKRNDSIKRAVEEMNKKAKNSEVVFGIHDATNRVVIKIVDKKTRELLKEYPPEETLDMIAKVWELAGIMIDEKG